VTLVGTNFGGWDTTVKVRIGSTAATTITWMSTSAVVARTGPGQPASWMQVTLSVATSRGSARDALSFDAAQVTGVAPHNSGSRGSSNITILGLNFGILPLPVSASLGDTACSWAEWRSDTSILCTPPLASPGGPRRVWLGKGGGDLKGGGHLSAPSVPALFSHDTPVLKAVTPSSANMKGGTSLVLTGANFGAVDGSLEAYLGGTPCDSLSWTSDSSMTCATQPSSPGTVPVCVKMPETQGVPSSATPSFTSALLPPCNGAEQGFLNNSLRFLHVETSAPVAVLTTPPPLSSVYVERDCSGGAVLSTNSEGCNALLPDGQGVFIPPGVWPVTERGKVSVTVVGETISMMTAEALQDALLISSVLYLQPTGTEFKLGAVEVKLIFDSNVLTNAGSRIVAVQKYNNNTKKWERLTNTSTSCRSRSAVVNMSATPATSGTSRQTRCNSSYAHASTTSFSYYAAFLVFPQEPVRVPLQPPTSAKVSDSSMWGRLTYVERLLIVLVPSLASLLLLALCLFNFCHWKQPDKHNETVVNTVPDLELSTVETPLVFSPGEGSEGAPAHTPTYTPTSSRPTLEEIRSMVRQEVHEEFEKEKSHLSHINSSRLSDLNITGGSASPATSPSSRAASKMIGRHMSQETRHMSQETPTIGTESRNESGTISPQSIGLRMAELEQQEKEAHKFITRAQQEKHLILTSAQYQISLVSPRLSMSARPSAGGGRGAGAPMDMDSLMRLDNTDNGPVDGRMLSHVHSGSSGEGQEGAGARAESRGAIASRGIPQGAGLDGHEPWALQQTSLGGHGQRTREADAEGETGRRRETERLWALDKAAQIHEERQSESRRGTREEVSARQAVMDTHVALRSAAAQTLPVGEWETMSWENRLSVLEKAFSPSSKGKILGGLHASNGRSNGSQISIQRNRDSFTPAPPLQEVVQDMHMHLGAQSFVSDDSSTNFQSPHMARTPTVHSPCESPEAYVTSASDVVSEQNLGWGHGSPEPLPLVEEEYNIALTLHQEASWLLPHGEVDMVVFSQVAQELKRDVTQAMDLPQSAVEIEDLDSCSEGVLLHLKLMHKSLPADGPTPSRRLTDLAKQVEDASSPLRLSRATMTAFRASANGPRLNFTCGPVDAVGTGNE